MKRLVISKAVRDLGRVGGFLLLTMGLGCKKTIPIAPAFLPAGYRAVYVMGSEVRETNRPWIVEGIGGVRVEGDAIEVTLPAGSEGLVLWHPVILPKNFLIEYRVIINEKTGTVGCYFCVNREKEPFFQYAGERSGRKEDYAIPGMRGYLLQLHMLRQDGKPMHMSRIRKNPNQYLLAHSEKDPCAFPGTYLIDILKVGSRIHVYVNGELVHDVRDKKGFDLPIYSQGYFGLRFDGSPWEATTRVEKIRVFRIKPNG